MFTSAALWELWKLRNHLCFQNGRWESVNGVMMKIANLVHNRNLNLPELESSLSRLNGLARQPGRLGSVKMELLGFLGKYGADWQDGQVLKRLALLLADGQITRTA
jgi:hypothetical protein